MHDVDVKFKLSEDGTMASIKMFHPEGLDSYDVIACLFELIEELKEISAN